MSNKLKLLYSILDDHILLLNNSERVVDYVRDISEEIVLLCKIIEDYENE